MLKLTEEIIYFLKNQGFVIVSTIGEDGAIHNSCKGIVEIDENGKIYLLDLYHGRTFQNLKKNPNLSLTTVDEHKFAGYSLKGTARIVTLKQLGKDVKENWEDMIVSRVTRRLLKNIREGRLTRLTHPEILLPEPKYIIAMEVQDVTDLAPSHLKNNSKR